MQSNTAAVCPGRTIRLYPAIYVVKCYDCVTRLKDTDKRCSLFIVLTDPAGFLFHLIPLGFLCNSLRIFM